MFIVFGLILLIQCDGRLSKPLESTGTANHDQSDLAKTLKAIKELDMFIGEQLARCFLWSKTLPHQERLDYLIALHRKIADVKLQRAELYKDYQQPFKWVASRMLTSNHLVQNDYNNNLLYRLCQKPITIGLLVFVGSFIVLLIITNRKYPICIRQLNV